MKTLTLITVISISLSFNLFGSTLHVPIQYSAIQDAINAASSGDMILVDPGTYVENISFSGKAITVTSTGGPEVTVIDGGKPSNPTRASVVTFESYEGPDSVIDGFTITNGSGRLIGTWLVGGGISCFYDTGPTIRNNVIAGNTIIGSMSVAGGGIGCWPSDPSVPLDPAYPHIEGNIITGNTVISGNDSGGGGIGAGHNSAPFITGNIISGNQVLGLGTGGGITIGAESTFDIVNNLIFDNESPTGGGVSLLTSTGTFSNNTLYDNMATKQGGGIVCCGFTTVVELTVVNSVLWNNFAPSGTEIALGQNTVLHIDYSDMKNDPGAVHLETGAVLDWGANMIESDPLFKETANDDFHLTQLSPCINRGTNSVGGLPGTDFEGDARPCMGTADMGADEFTGLHLLEADQFHVESTLGGNIAFDVNAGASNAYRKYFILSSVSGSSSGTTLPGGKVLTLNWDVITDLVLQFANVMYFMDFHGQLDAGGGASATFECPVLAPFYGFSFTFAYTLLSPYDFVSNPVQVEVMP